VALLISSSALDASEIAIWAKTLRNGLARFHGEGGESFADYEPGVRELNPRSRQSRLVAVLERLLATESTPQEAAAETEVIVMENPDQLFAILTGIYFSAVEAFADEVVMQQLVDYLVTLAKLPDAINTTSAAFEIDGTAYVQPGEIVELADGRLWCDLPGFDRQISQSFQGMYTYLERAMFIHCLAS
jgi:hypothetical protein